MTTDNKKARPAFAVALEARYPRGTARFSHEKHSAELYEKRSYNHNNMPVRVRSATM
ncbi:uncharacterized protein L969DRAFT_47196 [Mixia osmundae IAM 14324]|uniref:Uncharacterized protein n=1 Tax=Mixia osmundae (strain CBS 9802 / IAM 14324 / JCM 22182 / KY 12970) TaxID=764103 RepID=G7E9Q6_MIXOS|nr:uncharacterized protein L969DRAFT_47196 [Mixia osmundae IAM 14324]KEI40006.1 hypothetical protein L969DRAFT_47196 [Mixia osmundae IAM 14324]GAA99375.1 hypothetical protein E5Q_06071 [Mixia osmundae IAM 14324]